MPTKTLYLDIFSGISGDMFIGAMIDLGVDVQQLEQEIGKLGVGGYHLHAARNEKSGIAGVKFDVHLDQQHGHPHAHPHTHPHTHSPPRASAKKFLNASFTKHSRAEAVVTETEEQKHRVERNLTGISKIISSSDLSDWVKDRAIKIFSRIAVAEGRIHGVAPEAVHFHEVGAVDSIVDIVGACIALELLGKPRVLAGTVQEGTGWVKCEHGRFPVPTPATLAILGDRGVAVTQCEEPHELVTPTGAALLAEFAESFCPMQGLVAERVGFGLGTRENKTRPNVLRAVLGKIQEESNSEELTPNIQHSTSNVPKQPAVASDFGLESAPAHLTPDTSRPSSLLDWETDTVAVLETNLDDINAELLGAFVEKALAAGALDVFHTPIQMKKNRPGVLLTVLCAEADADKFSELLLRETTAFGVRRTLAERRKLQREFVQVTTPFGEVTMKLGKLGGEIVQFAPEFESCRAAAEQFNVPLKLVYEAALLAWQHSHSLRPHAEGLQASTKI